MTIPSTQAHSLRLLLVGSHFHKPSKQILAALPNGASVALHREPSNPYDENAIRVEVLAKEIDGLALSLQEEALEGSGFTSPEVLGDGSPVWQLGHVGASGGKPLEKARKAGIFDVVGNLELLLACEAPELPAGRLYSSSDGTYTIEVSVGEAHKTED